MSLFFSSPAVAEVSDELLISTKDYKDVKTVTRQQCLEDVNFLKRNLRQVYGPQDYFGQKFDKLLENIDAKLCRVSSAGTSLKTSDICKNIDDVIWDIPDNHFYAKTKSVESCSSKRKEYFSSKKKSGKNIAHDSDLPWVLKSKSCGQKNMLLLGVRHFDFGKKAKWSDLLKQFENLYKQADLIVLDFRGNGGGYNEVMGPLGEIIFSGEKAPTVLKAEHNIATVGTYSAFANMFKFKQFVFKDRKKTIPVGLNQDYKKILTALHQMKSHKKFTPFVPMLVKNKKQPLPKIKHKIPIYVLQDGGTGSSGEGAIIDLLKYPYLTTVGLPTVGMIDFGNAGLVVLPHSKIQIHVSTKYKVYEKGLRFERKGIVPDWQLKPSQDALKFVEQKICDS